MNNTRITLAFLALILATPAAAAKKKPPAAPTPPEPAVSAPKAPTTDPNGREVRTIPLDEKRAARVYIIHTAPSYPATVEFPEPFAAPPACGDCATPANPKGGLFLLDTFNDAHYLTIKPHTFAGPQPDGTMVAASDFVTVLTVRLQSYTLTIQVEYTDNPALADPRVVFTLPGRAGESAYVHQEIAKARKTLEEEMGRKIQRGVTTAFLRALTEPHYCTTVSKRARHEDLVVEVKELCHFGPNYYLRFFVENRSSTPVDLGSVTLNYSSASSGPVTADAEQYLSVEHLEFQTTAAGVVGFHLDEGQNAPRTFDIAVHEKGGLGRTITLAGIEP